MKAFIVCGPESSGNRLLAAILIRSGCTGSSSTDQPKRSNDITATDKLVIIAHHGISTWIAALRNNGYDDITALLIIREPIAMARSAVARGHSANDDDARTNRNRTVLENMRDAISARARVDVVTYEGLSEQFLVEWLPTIGLPYRSGYLTLLGQLTPQAIANQNYKYYEDAK